MELTNNTPLIEIAKGVVVGMGMIAPGLSGGVFAVALGIYPRIISGIEALPKTPIKVIKDLWWIGIGGLIGFLITFLILLQLIAYVPLPFSLLFIGFIIGSTPAIYHKLGKDVKPGVQWTVFIIGLALIIAMPFLPSSARSFDSLNLVSILILISVGFIMAGTLIIPGLSGSMVMMALGFYTFLLNSARDLIDAVLAFDVASTITLSLPLVMLGVGLLIGLVAFATGMKQLLVRFPSAVYAFILGLLVASPFSILFEAIQEYPNFFDQLIFQVPLSIVFAILGWLLARWMSRLEGRYEH